MKYRLKIFYF